MTAGGGLAATFITDNLESAHRELGESPEEIREWHHQLDLERSQRFVGRIRRLLGST